MAQRLPGWTGSRMALSFQAACWDSPGCWTRSCLPMRRWRGFLCSMRVSGQISHWQPRTLRLLDIRPGLGADRVFLQSQLQVLDFGKTGNRTLILHCIVSCNACEFSCIWKHTCTVVWYICVQHLWLCHYVIGCFLCNCRNCQDRRYKEFYHPGTFVWHEAEKREALNISAFPRNLKKVQCWGKVGHILATRSWLEHV